MKQTWLRFRDDRRGNFAIMTALLAIPMVGAAGLAIDYTRVLNARTYLQDRSDAIALAIGSKGPKADSSAYLTGMTADAQANSDFGPITFTAGWTATEDYEVTAEASVPMTLSSVIPGVSDAMAVSAQSVVRYKPAVWKTEAPTVAQLDPEAGDYNRISAYCYDPDKVPSRSQMAVIADNGGTTFDNPMPTCPDGAHLSYMLYNSRNARSNKALWDDPNNTHYEYYTDTTLNGGGAEKYDLGGWPILETVLCDTAEQCVGKGKGGVIPEGKFRKPQHNSKACAEGKYMYYGWEDRPQGRQFVDDDFDDIRIVIKCPYREKTSDEAVRLVK